jgi:hypothetical protein
MRKIDTATSGGSGSPGGTRSRGDKRRGLDRTLSAQIAKLSTASSPADELQVAGGSVNVGLSAAPSAGQVLTATSGSAAEWQTPAAGGSDDIVHAEGGNANVLTTSTYAVAGQKTLTVAAGDIIEVHCAGTLESATASVLWEWAVELSANGNTHLCLVRDNGTIAASVTNKAPWIWRSTSTITGATCRTTALSTRAVPVNSTAAGASTSGSTIRMNWKHTAADFTGSCTVRLLVRTTVTQANVYTLVDSFWIQQTPTRP